MQRFTREHLWVETQDGGNIRIGLSDVLARAIGEVESLVLPEVGEGFSLGDAFAEVEGENGHLDLYLPVEGVVYEINEALLSNPEALTDDPLEAWLVEIEDIGEIDELLSESEYLDLVD